MAWHPGKWESLYDVEHTQSLHGQYNWVHLMTLAKLKNLRERKILQSLSNLYQNSRRPNLMTTFPPTIFKNIRTSFSNKRLFHKMN